MTADPTTNTTTPGEQELSGDDSAGALGIDVDEDGNVTVYHEDLYESWEGHQMTLSRTDIATLLDFFDTPQGKRVQDLARASVADGATAEPPAANGRTSDQLGALVAVHEVVQAADDRVCGDVRVTDLRDTISRVMDALAITGTPLPDARFGAGTFWADMAIEHNEGAAAIGMLLKLRAMADHPDVCAAVFRTLADKLEQGLFSDTRLEPDEV